MYDKKRRGVYGVSPFSRGMGHMHPLNNASAMRCIETPWVEKKIAGASATAVEAAMAAAPSAKKLKVRARAQSVVSKVFVSGSA